MKGLSLPDSIHRLAQSLNMSREKKASAVFKIHREEPGTAVHVISSIINQGPLLVPKCFEYST